MKFRKLFYRFCRRLSSLAPHLRDYISGKPFGKLLLRETEITYSGWTGKLIFFFLIVLFVLYCQLCFLFDNFCLSLCSSFSVDLVNITGRSQVCFFSVLFFSSVNKFSSSLQKGSDVKNENEHLLIKAKRKVATQEK